MKKIDKFFVKLIIIELIALLVVLLFFRTTMNNNTCIHVWSFFNPFGFHKEPLMCGQAFTEMINPMIYQITDLLVLTIIAYLIYLLVNKFKNSKSLKGGKTK